MNAALPTALPHGFFRLPTDFDPTVLARDPRPTIRVDLRALPDKAALLETLAKAFGLPDWFGHNWDALYDSITDAEFLPEGGCIVLLEGVPAFRATHPELWESLSLILADCAEFWKLEALPVTALVDLETGALAALPVPG